MTVNAVYPRYAHRRSAARAGISKQAMNQLLGCLESLGYIVRSDAPDEGRTRIIRDIQHEWSVELGSKHFAMLKELLTRVWESPLTR
jgi:hypothetical protein